MNEWLESLWRGFAFGLGFGGGLFLVYLILRIMAHS